MEVDSVNPYYSNNLGSMVTTKTFPRYLSLFIKVNNELLLKKSSSDNIENKLYFLIFKKDLLFKVYK